MSEKEEKRKSSRRKGRGVIVGFWSVILLIALFLFLKNVGVLTDSCWSAFATWPLILFIISVLCLLRRRWVCGTFLLTAAVFFWMPIWIPLLREQYPNLLSANLEDGFLRKYWYILIVVLAILMIIRQLFGRRHFCCQSHWEYEVKSRSRKKTTFSTKEGNGFIESNVVFNNSDRLYVNEDLTGGSFNIVFGSQNIDLRKCLIHNNEEAHIELNVVFGNAEILVPADWNVQLNVDSVFSSVDDHRGEKPTENNSKNTLILTGSCVFSSLVVKN